MSLTHPSTLSDPLTSSSSVYDTSTLTPSVWDKDYLSKINPSNADSVKSAVD